MKFLLNVYVDPADLALTAARTRSFSTDEESFADTVRRSGELVDRHVFADPSMNTVVRVRDEELLFTDGPYVATGTYTRSYYVLDCENLARVVELAGLHPVSRFHVVEIRPLMVAAGWEM